MFHIAVNLLLLLSQYQGRPIRVLIFYHILIKLQIESGGTDPIKHQLQAAKVG